MLSGGAHDPDQNLPSAVFVLSRIHGARTKHVGGRAAARPFSGPPLTPGYKFHLEFFAVTSASEYPEELIFYILESFSLSTSYVTDGDVG